MTDPTTLSAAELDAHEAFGPIVSALRLIYADKADVIHLADEYERLLDKCGNLSKQLVAQARRTEAAERENALLTRALALLCAQGGAVSGHVHTVTPSLETDAVQLLLTDGRVVTLRPVPHPPEETPQP
jgi:hypothetical protein